MRTRAFLLLLFLSCICVSQINLQLNDTAALKAMVVKPESFQDAYPDSVLYLSELVVKIISDNKSLPSKLKNTLLQIKAFAFHNLGNIYDGYGDVPRAVYNYEQSLKIYEGLKDKGGIALALNDLGQVYEYNGDADNAFLYYNKSLELMKAINDKVGEADILNNIAHIYQDKNKFDTAMIYFNKSMAIRRSSRDTFGIAISLNNLGTLYFMMGNIDEAERHFKESIPLREQLKDITGKAASLTNLAYVMVRKKKLKEAEKIAIEVMHLGYSLNQPVKIRSAAKLLYEIYKRDGNDEKALENYKIYIKMHDSINLEANKKASIKSQLKYQYEKKTTADSVRVVEERKVVAAQLKQEKTQRYTLWGGLILVGLFALFMVNRFRITNKQKKIIEEQKKVVEEQKAIVEEKQKEVLDSIHYAKRIQLSLLPQEKYIDKILKKKG